MKKQLPKNVRQIGNVSDSSKIYIEDYVDTFFNQLCDKAGEEPTGAFLIGETVQEAEQECIYVSGAIRISDISMQGTEIQIGEDVWKETCETCKQYFGDAEILGWFLSVSGQPREADRHIQTIHEKFFTREKSIFILKNAVDKEEQFYIHKYQNLMECGGHYIYYEKNLEMQNYMISSRKKIGVTPSEAVEDRATKDFRSLIKDKMEKNEEKHRSRFVYTATTLLVLVVLVAGVVTINHYDKIQGVQQSLAMISKSASNKKKEAVPTGGIVTEEKMPEQVIDEEKKSETELPKEEPKEEPEKVPENIVGITEDDIYVVKKGDTLATISKKIYGDISHVEAICKMNGLEDGNLIFIGQKMLLP